MVKESWQYINWPEEDKLICKAIVIGITNIAQYYYYETILFNGKKDYICSNVQNKMLITAGSNLLIQPNIFLPKIIILNKSDSFFKVVRSSGAFYLLRLTKTYYANFFGLVN